MTARLCLACRHVLEPGVACDQPGHAAVDLDAPGRARLVAAVWGEPDERIRAFRARARRQQRAGLAGLSSGVAAAIGIAATVGPARPLIWLGGLAAGALGATLAGAVQRRDVDVDLPRGAVAIPAPPSFARGTVRGADDRRSPASDLWAAAWAVELTLARPGGARTVFRDSFTAGFEIELDGGARARVPAGPWRPAGELVPLLDIDDVTLAVHLRGVDARYQPHDELGPFHHDLVLEALIMEGDRVELCGDWQPALDGRAADVSLYRDAPASVLVPTGWPTIRRLRT